MTATGSGNTELGENSRVGVLGIGLMGSAMARRLLTQGISVTAWDRDPEKARALEPHGAQSAERAGDLVSGCEVVITMLPTAGVILEVVEPLLEDWPDGDDLGADEQCRRS